MTKATTAPAPAATSASYLDSDKAARLRRARRMARGSASDSSAGAPAPEVADAQPVRGPSKIAAVLELLRRPDGATIEELIEATGWLPHTTHAALTGLRKKGHVLAKDKRGDVTCYRIAEAG